MSSLAAADEIDAFEGDDNDVLAGGPTGWRAAG